MFPTNSFSVWPINTFVEFVETGQGVLRGESSRTAQANFNSRVLSLCTWAGRVGKSMHSLTCRSSARLELAPTQTIANPIVWFVLPYTANLQRLVLGPLTIAEAGGEFFEKVLERCKQLVSLKLHLQQPAVADEVLEATTGLSNLTHLALHPGFSKTDAVMGVDGMLIAVPGRLTALTGLQKLSLGREIAVQMVSDDLGLLTNLKSLGFAPRTFPTVLTSLTNLRQLRASRYRYPGHFPSLTALASLTSLYLEPHSDLARANLQGLDGKLPSGLQFLSFRSDHEPIVPYEVPTHLADLKQLTRLELLLTYDGSVPTDLAHLTNLQCLVLGNPRHTSKVPEAAIDAACVLALEQLQHLSLGSNKVALTLELEPDGEAGRAFAAAHFTPRATLRRAGAGKNWAVNTAVPCDRVPAMRASLAKVYAALAVLAAVLH